MQLVVARSSRVPLVKLLLFWLLFELASLCDPYLDDSRTNAGAQEHPDSSDSAEPELVVGTEEEPIGVGDTWWTCWLAMKVEWVLFEVDKQLDEETEDEEVEHVLLPKDCQVRVELPLRFAFWHVRSKASIHDLSDREKEYHVNNSFQSIVKYLKQFFPSFPNAIDIISSFVKCLDESTFLLVFEQTREMNGKKETKLHEMNKLFELYFNKYCISFSFSILLISFLWYNTWTDDCKSFQNYEISIQRVAMLDWLIATDLHIH